MKKRIVKPRKSTQKEPKPLEEDEEVDSEVDSDDEEIEDDELEEEEEEESEEDSLPSEPTRPSVRIESPKPRPRRQKRSEPEYETGIEIVDLSAWPGTSEAAKLVGRHPSTIKLWRQQGKIRAQIDQSGVWRHNPDDLVELTEAPEPQDPATLLASGMSAIVSQGERAGDRLITMTERATVGLERACDVLSTNLEGAYARIRELETELADVYKRTNHSLEASFKHERIMKKLEHEQAVELEEKKSASAKLMGLLEVIGPIGASIAARVVGNEHAAVKAEERSVGTQGVGVSRLNTADLPVETRIADAMSRLKATICGLDDSTAKAFRLMLPEEVGKSFDVVRSPNAKDADIGEALAVITRASCSLHRQQFEALAPIAPEAVVAVLTELRMLINEEKWVTIR